jgi:hypothetical protein
MQDTVIHEPASFLIGSNRRPWEMAHTAGHANHAQYHELMMVMGTERTTPSSRQPPMTLNLFPTKSTGLKEECTSSKSSSSCSTTHY